MNKDNSRATFRKVERLEPGAVYTEGCLRELTRLMKLDDQLSTMTPNMNEGAVTLASSKVLYIGDSLFADLVDAKREYGWLTAAVTPEVGDEMTVQSESDYILVERTIEFLLNALRLLQAELGPSERKEEDLEGAFSYMFCYSSST